jgi:tRNA(Ile)-lysidine synthase
LILNTLNQNTVTQNKILLIEKIDPSENQTFINLESTIESIEGINKTVRWDFDAEKIMFPLQLRRKEEGDVFFPTGFSGKKKVSKFFKDEKLSILAKQKIWLLTDGNNRVLGILPFRQDRRYAKDERTKSILTIFNEK